MQERVMGEVLTASAGTALAFEALMVMEKPPKHEFIFLNVRTLWRNFFQAFDERPDEKDFKKLKELFLEELLYVKGLIENGLPVKMQPVFYVCSNKSMSAIFKHAKLKEPTTNEQKIYASLERKVIELIMETEFGKTIKIYDCLVKGRNVTALMMTHFPVELLSFTEFRTLDLFESNTGAIKDKSQWNSKLTNPENYRNLPFNALTIQVIGDKSHQFHSKGASFVKTLMEIAEKNNWSIATGKARVKFDVEKHYDKLAVNVFIEMLNAKLK
jgi:hypothetical protein